MQLDSTRPTYEMIKMNKIYAILILFLSLSCSGKTMNKKDQTIGKLNNDKTMENIQYATFGGGCFWCTEAIFEQLEGVIKVESGFSGGHIKNPAYKEVITGRTGHAEAIQISYDPSILSYEELLEIFFNTHDPTTLNRQGNDRGTQYRSAVFYHTREQQQAANNLITALEKANVFPDKIVTEVTEFDAFYVAEDYHQDYFVNNSNQPYCQYVINPKLEKFQKQYKGKLKKQ